LKGTHAYLCLTWLNVAGSETSTDPVKFTSDRLLERRRTFHENLLEKVKDYHEVRGFSGNNWGTKKYTDNYVQASFKVTILKTRKVLI
jgi:hypothetical protein